MDTFSISDLYSAYRKAKHEAFADGTYPCLLQFQAYEDALHSNLLVLKKALESKRKPWYRDRAILLGSGYLPKSISPVPSPDVGEGHYSTGDSTKDWGKAFGNGKPLAHAEFRLVINPSVAFQVISALWVMRVGRRFDACLDDSSAFGNRPRSAVDAHISGVSASDDSFALFKPYFSGYRNWRERGLRAMREALGRGESVVALTMDAKNYYHSISPRFLLSREFLRANQIELTSEQEDFTKELIAALEFWHRNTPGYGGGSRGAVPVGLSASKIIANVFLAEFDRAVVEKLDCEYYGRYVDDIILVAKGCPCQSSSEVLDWLAGVLPDYLSKVDLGGGEAGLQISRAYTGESRVVFAGRKQRIFLLEGEYGKDLVRQISEQIREASSEYRLIPSLKELRKVLVDALLASSEPDTDTLRKADRMSIRRHGLSIALRNLDGYSRDLDPALWKERRGPLYELILRHVISPTGLFTYAKQIVRVFGAMIACRDFAAALSLLDRFNEVLAIVFYRIDLRGKSVQLLAMVDYYRRSLLEVALASSTVAGFDFNSEFRRILRRLDPKRQVFKGNLVRREAARGISNRILLADLGRRPYKDYWYNENPTPVRQLRVPDVPFVRQQIELFSGLKRHIVRKLNDPNWKSLAFPTRPLTLPEICLMMPGLLSESDGVSKALVALRGAGVPGATGRPVVTRGDRFSEYEVPLAARNRRIQVAVPSYLTTDKQWKQAIKGRPDLSPSRYENLTKLVNDILRDAPDVDYIALPECSVPFAWAFSIAKSLSRSGVSFVCGLEPHPKDRTYRNDALVSLVTWFGGYPSHFIFRQPKMELAPHESVIVRKQRLKFQAPPYPYGRPLYAHGDFTFSVLLCSDLTNIANRRALQGYVDSLFILEWNPDVETFSFLVESAAHDLHAPIVQVNNRKYGDSRVRAPYKSGFDRDVVRVKGGDKDFFVIASFDHQRLRAFHTRARVGSKEYKPLPIGFKVSDARKFTRKR